MLGLPKLIPSLAAFFSDKSCIFLHKSSLSRSLFFSLCKKIQIKNESIFLSSTELSTSDLCILSFTTKNKPKGSFDLSHISWELFKISCRSESSKYKLGRNRIVYSLTFVCLPYNLLSSHQTTESSSP